MKKAQLFILDLFFHFYKEEQISKILKIIFQFSELKFALSELNYYTSLFVLCLLLKLGTHTNSKWSQQHEVVQLLCWRYLFQIIISNSGSNPTTRLGLGTVPQVYSKDFKPS